MDLSYKDGGRLDMLKKRTERCVCRYCGKPLTLHRIVMSDVDAARVEIFCEHCDRIEFGVEPEIYQSAAYFVDEMDFNYYADLDECENTRKMNIAKVCDIMAWENKHLNILGKDGFKVPIEMNASMTAETIIVDNEELAELEKLFGGAAQSDNQES